MLQLFRPTLVRCVREIATVYRDALIEGDGDDALLLARACASGRLARLRAISKFNSHNLEENFKLALARELGVDVAIAIISH